VNPELPADARVAQRVDRSEWTRIGRVSPRRGQEDDTYTQSTTRRSGLGRGVRESRPECSSRRLWGLLQSVVHALDSPQKPSPATPPELHELESEVMEEVWKRGESSVRDVMEALNRRTKRPTRLHDLHDDHDAPGREGVRSSVVVEGKTDIYSPIHDSRDLHGPSRRESEVQALVDQYGEVALSHFAPPVRRAGPSPRRRALQRLARRS